MLGMIFAINNIKKTLKVYLHTNVNKIVGKFTKCMI